MPDLSGLPRVVAAIAKGALQAAANAFNRGIRGFGLFNWLRSKFAPLNSREGSALYRSSMDYVNAGTPPSGGPAAGLVNPASVPQFSPSGGYGQPPGAVIYDTRIQYRDEVTGRTGWSTVYFHQGQFLTWADFQALVQEWVQDRIGPTLPSGTGGDNQALTLLGFRVFGIASF